MAVQGPRWVMEEKGYLLSADGSEVKPSFFAFSGKLQGHSLSLSLCGSMLVYMCMQVRVLCVWSQGPTSGIASQELSVCLLETVSILLIWNSLSDLGWLAREFRDICLSSPPSAGITSAHHHAHSFVRLLGLGTRSSCLCIKHNTVMTTTTSPSSAKVERDGPGGSRDILGLLPFLAVLGPACGSQKTPLVPLMTFLTESQFKLLDICFPSWNSKVPS